MSRIVSATQGLEDRISDIAEAGYAKYRKAIHPIYGEKRTAPEHIGTCFFLEVEGQRFVVTAAHVIDSSKQSALYVPVGDKLLPIEGAVACTTAPNDDRDADRYDFAYANADEAFFGSSELVSCIQESDISLNRVAVDQHAYMAIGYPRSKNKDPNNAKNSVDPKLWHYYATGKSVPEMYARLRLSGNDHVAIKYEQRSRTPDGDWENTISVRGMSGGPLFDLGAQRPPADWVSPNSFAGKLSGILIEHWPEDRVALFVKIQLVVEKIRAGVQKEAQLTPVHIR